jgi:hypothetical protein
MTVYVKSRNIRPDSVLIARRFSREVVPTTLQHLERLADAGVNCRSSTEELLDSTGVLRDAIIAMLAVIAR